MEGVGNELKEVTLARGLVDKIIRETVTNRTQVYTSLDLEVEKRIREFLQSRIRKPVTPAVEEQAKEETPAGTPAAITENETEGAASEAVVIADEASEAVA